MNTWRRLTLLGWQARTAKILDLLHWPGTGGNPTHVSLDPHWLPGPLFGNERERMAFALLVIHYWADGFLVDGQEIIPRIHELNGIPGYLIHGRRDISGPSVTAWRLHQRWESSRLVIIEDEGHGGPASMAALTQAVEQITSLA